MIVDGQDILVDHFLQQFVWVLVVFKVVYFLLLNAAITFVDSLFQPFLAVYVILDPLSVRLTVFVKALSGMCIETQELSRVTMWLSPDKTTFFEANDQIIVLRIIASLDTSRIKDTLLGWDVSVLDHSSIPGERIFDFVK